MKTTITPAQYAALKVLRSAGACGTFTFRRTFAGCVGGIVAAALEREGLAEKVPRYFSTCVRITDAGLKLLAEIEADRSRQEALLRQDASEGDA